MTMSNWQACVSEMDRTLINEFSISVIVHQGNDHRELKGVFDNPSVLSSIPGGGYVSSQEAELYVKDVDALGIEVRDLVTVANKQWIVIKPPESDGTGLTKLFLGVNNGQQSPSVEIRY